MTISADVAQLIADARDYADGVFDEAKALVSDAQRAAQSNILLDGPELAYSASDVPDNIHLDFLPSTFTDSYVAPSDAGIDLPDFNEFYIPERPTFGDAPAPLNASELFQVEAPVWNLSEFSESAPNVNTDNLQSPDAPTVLFPDAPEGTSSLTAPQIVAPTFDEELEGSTPEALTDLSTDYRTDYKDILPEMRDAIEGYADGFLLKHNPEFFNAMSSLESKIDSALNSDSAISDAVEQQIFNRARDRTNDEHEAVQRQYADSHKKRGFPIPPGSMMGGLGRAQESVSRNISSAASNIAVERAKMELQHTQFAMQLSSSMRMNMIGYALQYHGNLIQINSQALECARQIGAFAAEVFNQRLAIYQQQLTVYQTLAEVYRIRLESAFANLRSFEAQVEAERLKSEVDRNQVAIYEAKIGAERTKIDTYVAQLRGVESKANIERLKVDVFESQVRAYSERIRGKEAEYRAFEAAMKGDESKVSVYREQVNAYRAGIDAARTKVDAERSHSDSIANYNRLLIAQFDANIRKYETEVRAEGTRFGNSVNLHQLALQKYSTTLQGRLQSIRTQYDKERLDLQAALGEYGGNIDVMKAQADVWMSRSKNMSDAAIAGSNVLEGLGAAAVSANNTMVNWIAEE